MHNSSVHIIWFRELVMLLHVESFLNSIFISSAFIHM